MPILELDGAHGEGGGQLVRTAVALAAIAGVPMRLVNVRAGRAKPGLAPQHLAAVRAVASLCGAECSGLDLRSQAFSFAPKALRSGEYRFHIGTAGSVTLVLQAVLPVLACASARSRVTVTGGSDVRGAPPVDYLRNVLLPILERMGLAIECRVLRRGYYPRGGGEVEISVTPSRPRALVLERGAGAGEVQGLAHVSNLPAHIAERMRDAARGQLGGIRSRIETTVLGGDAAIGQGGAIALWARTQHAVLGAARAAERGVRAEALGADAGAEIAADLAAGAALDRHAADQVLVYLALARGGGFTARALTRHARTAIWLIEQFLPVRFDTSQAGGLERVEVCAR